MKSNRLLSIQCNYIRARKQLRYEKSNQVGQRFGSAAGFHIVLPHSILIYHTIILYTPDFKGMSHNMLTRIRLPAKQNYSAPISVKQKILPSKLTSVPSKTNEWGTSCNNVINFMEF